MALSEINERHHLLLKRGETEKKDFLLMRWHFRSLCDKRHNEGELIAVHQGLDIDRDEEEADESRVTDCSARFGEEKTALTLTSDILGDWRGSGGDKWCSSSVIWYGFVSLGRTFCATLIYRLGFWFSSSFGARPSARLITMRQVMACATRTCLQFQVARPKDKQSFN
jgi:hypothetical protein